MIDLLEELKNHELERIDFRAHRYAVTLCSGEFIKATTPEMLTNILKAIRGWNHVQERFGV
ncbi:hypothetical protein ULT26_004313 [Salmonella enterica]|nr:hypothetical protein [Salmonella enterica]